MKNIIKLLGIIAVVAVIGFSFVSCDSGSTDVSYCGCGSNNCLAAPVCATGQCGCPENEEFFS